MNSHAKSMHIGEEKGDQQVAVVTGSSTGIGYETSLALARNGFLIYVTMKNLNKHSQLDIILFQIICVSH
jgi:NAD(P)-dependent dehydrogenase (short-subunit alcohol dehydrogenase family)